MKTSHVLPLCVLAAALGAGCASSGPNTRQGAVGGAVAGAIAGGIIGNNHGSRNVASGAAIGAAAGGLAGAAIGNQLDYARGTTDVSMVDRRYYVAQPPPIPAAQPRDTIRTRPAREAVWIQGYWAYTGNPGQPYEWSTGHWEIPPPGNRAWVPAGWHHSGNGYVYLRGHWQ
jgi:hypothetical protein